MKLLRIGTAALRLYANHMLVWTIGVICGAVEAFVVLCAIWGPCK